MPALDLPQIIPGLGGPAEHDQRLRLNRDALFADQQRKAQSDDLALEAQQRKNETAKGFDPTAKIPGLELHAVTQDSSGNVASHYAPIDPSTIPVSLDNMDENEKSMAKALVEARMPVTALGRLPAANKTRIIAAAQQMNPEFNMNEYGSRQRIRQAFTSGPQAANITSANTAVGHLNNLMEAGTELHNSSLQPWNTVANYVQTKVGNPATTKFNVAANAVVSELAKLFKGTGAATDQEIREWRNAINTDMSPQQIQASIGEAVKLMGSRLDALKNQWEQGVKAPKDFKFLDDRSRAVLNKFGFNPDALDPVEGGEPQANQPAPQPEAPAPRATTPQPGEVRAGFRYKGGNPADQANWEQVQ